MNILKIAHTKTTHTHSSNLFSHMFKYLFLFFSCVLSSPLHPIQLSLLIIHFFSLCLSSANCFPWVYFIAFFFLDHSKINAKGSAQVLLFHCCLFHHFHCIHSISISNFIVGNFILFSCFLLIFPMWTVKNEILAPTKNERAHEKRMRSRALTRWLHFQLQLFLMLIESESAKTRSS